MQKRATSLMIQSIIDYTLLYGHREGVGKGLNRTEMQSDGCAFFVL